jgi:MFS family permease
MATSWARVVILYGFGVLAAGQIGLAPPLIPTLQRDLGMSLAGAGAIVSIMTLVAAVLGLPAGSWSERIGHARALRGGLLILAAAAVVAARSDSASLLLAARAVAGVGYLLVVIASPSLITLTAELRHQSAALSLWSTFVPVGIALAEAMSAGFLEGAGWRLIFVADAVVLGGATLLATLTIPATLTRRQPGQRFSRELLAGSARLTVAFFCFAWLFLAVAGLLPAYLVERRGLSEASAGQLVAIVTLFGILGSLVAGWLMRRRTTASLVMAAGLLASTLVAGLCFSLRLPISAEVAGFALSFALGGLAPAAAFASVPIIARDARAIGPINGLVAQAGSLGSLAGPPLLALWVGWAGWASAPILLLSVAAVGAICALRSTAPT